MNLQQYNFEGHQVRIQMVDGEPMFCAMDICAVAEIRNHRDALARLDDDEKVLINSNVGNTDVRANRGMLFVNESGLWALVLTSRKPAAKRLSKWLRSEVIPSIRKTGVYASSDAALAAEFSKRLSDPSSFTKMMCKACDTIDAQQAQVAEMQPKAELHDAILSTDNVHTAAEAAKMYGFTGRNRLLKFLRDQGVLLANNEPRQQYVDAGELLVRPITLQDGKVDNQPVFRDTGLIMLNKVIARAEQTKLLLGERGWRRN